MLKLVKNEYQKQFCKKGTYVLLVFVLLIMAGYHFLVNSSIFSSSYYDWRPDKEYVESDLEWYKQVNDSDGSFDVEIALYEAMLKYEVYDADYWGTSQSWQGLLLNQAYYGCYSTMLYSDEEEEVAAAKEQFDAYISFIEANDWHLYYRYCTQIYADSPNTAYSYQYMLDHEIDPDSDDWRISVLKEMTELSSILDMYESIAEEDRGTRYEQTKQRYEILKYRLEQNIQFCVTDAVDNYNYDIMGNVQPYTFASPFWSNVYNASSMQTLVCIMMIVIAGGVIASEFSQGTIKFLLINPVKRSKIFFSKYFMLLSLTVLLSVCVFGVNILLSLIGADGADAVFLSYENGAVLSGSILPVVLAKYAYAIVENIVIITLSFMISSLLRSSSVAIGVSLGALFLGNTVTTLLAALGQDWGRYLLFANLNLGSIIQKSSLYPHHSVGFAVTVIVVHMVIFLLTAYDGFTRREV